MMKESLAESNLSLYDSANRDSIMSDPDYNDAQNINNSIAEQNELLERQKRLKQKHIEKMNRVKDFVLQRFPHAKLDREISGFLRFNLGKEIKVSKIL